MNDTGNVSRFFDGFAVSFDRFYEGKRGRLMRWVDRRFRSDMLTRFALTFEKLGDLTGRSVVDIGCGSGPYMEEALRRGASRVTGVDPAREMLSLAGKRLEEGSFTDRWVLVEGWFPGVPLESCDHAIVMGVLDYVGDPAAFLGALLPVVRLSAALSFPSRHWLRTPVRKLRYRLRKCPVHFFDEAAIHSLTRAAGFRRCEIFKIPGMGMDYHVTLKP